MIWLIDKVKYWTLHCLIVLTQAPNAKSKWTRSEVSESREIKAVDIELPPDFLLSTAKAKLESTSGIIPTSISKTGNWAKKHLIDTLKTPTAIEMSISTRKVERIFFQESQVSGRSQNIQDRGIEFNLKSLKII